MFREIFAGKGGLTKAMRKYKRLRALTPLESHYRGYYRRDLDIMNNKTFKSLCEQAKLPRQYWHFAVPCSSFSRMSVNLNGGTRTHEVPQGSGGLPRDILGNELLKRTCILISILIRAGSFWSIENPKNSLLVPDANYPETHRTSWHS